MAIFAKYDGIDGESKDANHERWIDVLSLDWGIHRPAAGATGQSRRRGDAVVDDLVLTMGYDKSSPKLLEKGLQGGVVPKLEIELTATFGGSRGTYLRYELENVLVSSYQVSASGDDESGPPTVVVANSFEQIEVTYTEFDDTGSTRGNVEASWDLEKGRTVKKKPKKK